MKNSVHQGTTLIFINEKVEFLVLVVHRYELMKLLKMWIMRRSELLAGLALSFCLILSSVAADNR